MEYGLKDLAILMRWLEVSILKKVCVGGGGGGEAQTVSHFQTFQFSDMQFFHFITPPCLSMTGPYHYKNQFLQLPKSSSPLRESLSTLEKKLSTYFKPATEELVVIIVSRCAKSIPPHAGP